MGKTDVSEGPQILRTTSTPSGTEWQLCVVMGRPHRLPDTCPVSPRPPPLSPPRGSWACIRGTVGPGTDRTNNIKITDQVPDRLSSTNCSSIADPPEARDEGTKGFRNNTQEIDDDSTSIRFDSLVGHRHWDGTSPGVETTWSDTVTTSLYHPRTDRPCTGVWDADQPVRRESYLTESTHTPHPHQLRVPSSGRREGGGTTRSGWAGVGEVRTYGYRVTADRPVGLRLRLVPQTR